MVSVLTGGPGGSGSETVAHLLARAYIETNQMGQAKQLLKGLVDRFPTYEPARMMLTQILIKDGFEVMVYCADDPIQAKYLNTSESMIYKKSQVLFGLDQAKREIAKRKQAVIVEGYTDVMACHLAGVKTAGEQEHAAPAGNHVAAEVGDRGDVGVLANHDDRGEVAVGVVLAQGPFEYGARDRVTHASESLGAALKSLRSLEAWCRI